MDVFRHPEGQGPNRRSREPDAAQVVLRALSAPEKDTDLAADVFSSLISDKLADWVGPDARHREASIFCEIVTVALGKHKSLKGV